MLGATRREALKLHDRAEEVLRELAAPSAPTTNALMEVLDAIGDYDEDAGEVITDAAKQVIMFSFMRGYCVRLASNRPIEVSMPDGDPEAAAVMLIAEIRDDAWFFSRVFPQGRKVWDRITIPFATVANQMLLEEQPDGPTFPVEAIDDMLRAGYIAGHVDEWFGLRPVYREP
jgi:hypothetical protein